jgi:hypothetical protein
VSRAPRRTTEEIFPRIELLFDEKMAAVNCISVSASDNYIWCAIYQLFNYVATALLQTANDKKGPPSGVGHGQKGWQAKKKSHSAAPNGIRNFCD